MPSINLLISTLVLAVVVSAGSIVTPISRGAIIPPALRGVWEPTGKLVAADTPKTNFAGIAATANSGNQESSTTSSRLQISDASVINLSNPATPSAYELVFGPTSGANNASGYMGFSLLALYDPSACAALCNARAADPVGGSCQYFNVWRATLLGIPLVNVCTMYYIPTDASTATTTSTNGLKVTQSRGYKRKNLVIDGGFEGYAPCSDFCFAESYANWIGTSPAGGTQDATIFYFTPYAHTGHSVGLLGSANNDDALPGTLTTNAPLLTTASKQYKIGFFHASSFSGPSLAGPAFVNVKWNGATVKTIHPGYSNYTYFEVKVTGTGHDTLAFNGGIAPAWSFLDDISVYQL